MEWFLIPFIIIAALGMAVSAVLGLFTFMGICFNLANIKEADWDTLWVVFKTAIVSLAIGCTSALIFHGLA